MKNPHRISSPLSIVFAIALVATASTALAQQESPIVAERPGHFAVPTLVEQGDVVIESGVSLQDDEAVANRTRTIISTLRYPSTLVRIGVLGSLELRVSGEYVMEHTTVSSDTTGPTRREGLNSIGVGAKIGIQKEDGGAPEIALFAGLGLPVGNRQFIPQSVAPSLTLGMRSTLSSKLSLFYSVGGSWSGSGPAAVESYSVALTDAITPELGGFVEIYGSAGAGIFPAHSFDAGLGLLLTPQFQVDVFGGRGLTAGASVYYVSFGMALRLPGALRFE